MDPLNHFADFERFLLDPSDNNYRIFTSTIKNEMPYQTFLELCLISNLLALLVYKGHGETGAAQELLQGSGNSKNQQWIKAVFNNEQAIANDLEKEFENNNYFLIIKKISEF